VNPFKKKSLVENLKQSDHDFKQTQIIVLVKLYFINHWK